MEPSNPSGDAVAVSGKRILAAGKLEDVKKTLGDRPYTVDETFKSKNRRCPVSSTSIFTPFLAR